MKQDENSPKQLPKRKMIGDDDSIVASSGRGEFLSKRNEVFYIKGQYGPPLTGRENKLIEIRMALVARFVGGDTVQTAIS